MRSKMLIDPSKGWEPINAIKDTLCTSPAGQMTYFYLCCSTGVLHNVVASPVTATNECSLTSPSPLAAVNVSVIKAAKYIHEIIREANKAGTAIIYPKEVAAWNALSLCLAKAVEGQDKHGPGAYSGYKAAQIVMADRIVADKRNKAYKFGNYNITFSVDHLMDWLAEQDEDLGEVLVSTAQPGGHGARVRAAIYSPNNEVLTKYHNDRIKIVRNHVLGWVKWAKNTSKTVPADNIAGLY